MTRTVSQASSYPASEDDTLVPTDVQAIGVKIPDPAPTEKHSHYLRLSKAVAWVQNLKLP
jgi:hypothetical protein